MFIDLEVGEIEAVVAALIEAEKRQEQEIKASGRRLRTGTEHCTKMALAKLRVYIKC